MLIRGVLQVEQGWIASQPPNDAFSEAVIVTYDPVIIALTDLIAIHLHTHASTFNHSMRHKYRSAVYWFNAEEETIIKKVITELQWQFNEPVITQVLPFADFKSSLPEHLNYYYSNPEKPFCTLYIHPKLELLKKKYARFT
jgi:peptide-methionine (S)-S-oxide reductase